MPRFMEFKVTLQEADPAPWRQFLIKENATFLQLHRAIQDACGWMDYHLYEFVDGDNQPVAYCSYDELDPEFYDYAPEARSLKLKKYFVDPGDSCAYHYDWGDDWWHDVELLGFKDIEARGTRVLLAGERAFPPEDAGGISGYEDCIEALRRPERADPHILTWLDDWRPDAFDFERIKPTFDRGRRPRHLRDGFFGR